MWRHFKESYFSTVGENHVSEPAIVVFDDIGKVESYNLGNGEVLVEEEETRVPELVDEVPDDSQIAESSSRIEEVPKKAYACMVKVMKESDVPFSAAPHASLRTV